MKDLLFNIFRFLNITNNYIFNNYNGNNYPYYVKYTNGGYVKVKILIIINKQCLVTTENNHHFIIDKKYIHIKQKKDEYINSVSNKTESR